MAIFGAIGSEFASDEPDDFTTGTPSYAVLGAMGNGTGNSLPSGIADFNDVPHGIYTVIKSNGAMTNSPATGMLRGCVFCFKVTSAGTYTNQIYLDGRNDVIYYRIRGESSWESWKQVTLTALT